jgi:acyl carrier protein phosphodiesterase
MNYLAHLFLAGEDENLILGTFIADHVKGSSVDSYNYRVKRGIVMHRQIDAYTDNHPSVKESIQRLRPSYHKYSGVIVDMFYDHYLAHNFNDYSPVPLNQYTKNRYEILFHNYGILPSRSQRLLTHMAENDWLSGYSTIEGIHEALYGLSNRTKFHSGMNEAVNDLKAGYGSFEKEFRDFFPQVMHFAGIR